MTLPIADALGTVIVYGSIGLYLLLVIGIIGLIREGKNDRSDQN